jgi:murein DD-endopeptidase MepM/ murein hydrolase activator NlpD
MINRHLLLLILLTTSRISAALPEESRTLGGIALLPLPEYAPLNVQALYQDTPVPVISTQHGRTAVVGIPLTATVGDASIQLIAADFADSLDFNIDSKDYPEQRITLKDTSKVTPNEIELARYAREAAEQKAVYKTFTPTIGAWPSFQMPIVGEFSSPFGLKRFFNGEARDPHSGLDIAAAEGKTVYSPADGKIMQTGDYFFNGQTVMIDHGQGIISMLCHLSKIDVVMGQMVQRGVAIGKVGHTGRATGPHLHWGLSINNARVNPLLVASPKP